MQAVRDIATADPMSPAPFRVVDRWDETDDTFTLRLDPPAGEYAFGPGQFNMLYVFGIGEVAISISGDPAEPETLIHTVRGVGSVTRALRGLAAGDAIGVRGPFGNTWPVDAARGHDIVFVAGGIGLAPLRPALYHVLRNRADFGRVVLLYGARTPRDILYTAEVQEWRGRLDMDVLVSVDNADRTWRGSVGVVTKLIGRAPFDPHNAMAFVCGPEIMMRFTGRELVTRGVGASMIHMSMERNMKCAVGVCGHCQFLDRFVCRDGPVWTYDSMSDLLEIREV
jgi:NAD(P)H-flavin reductase